MAAMESTAPLPGSRSPMRTIIGAAAKLNTGMSQAHCISWRLPLPQPSAFQLVRESNSQGCYYHFIRLISSTLTVERFRYIRSTMASAKPTSAAATVMMKIAISCPSKLAKGLVPSMWAAAAIRLIFTAFSISSMDIRMSTALRRASTPYKPITNSAALRSWNQTRSTMA